MHAIVEPHIFYITHVTGLDPFFLSYILLLFSRFIHMLHSILSSLVTYDNPVPSFLI
jgi:hypothetical protein